MVLLFNSSAEPFTIRSGDYIAQLVFVHYYAPTSMELFAMDGSRSAIDHSAPSRDDRSFGSSDVAGDRMDV